MKKIVLSIILLLTMSSSAFAQPCKHYSQWLTYSEMKRVPEPYLLDFSTKPKWSYVMGIELESFLDTYLTYGGDEIKNYLKAYTDKMIASDGKITGYKYEDFNLDNVRTGKFVFRMNQLYPSHKDSAACETLMRQLDNQPRTKAGPWYHKAIYANQVWLDGIFMGLPFYTLATPSLRTERSADYYADAIHQMKATFEKTYDAHTGLWKHAWDETGSIFWANPKTGLSKHTWGRALGWFAMAYVEVLSAMPENTPRREELINMFNDVMTAVVRCQDPETGLWYDVLDVNDKRNYLEATCSSMFSYCLLKGVRMGWLGKSFKAPAFKSYFGIIHKFIERHSDGTISLTDCVSVSGLGPEKNPKRDGSFDYYMSEPIRANDAKGVGPFIWASLEMERLGYDIRKTDKKVKKMKFLQ